MSIYTYTGSQFLLEVGESWVNVTANKHMVDVSLVSQGLDVSSNLLMRLETQLLGYGGPRNHLQALG